MNPTMVVVDGTLNPDGTLELDEKPSLPAGRVKVMLKSDCAESEADLPDSAVPLNFVQMAQALRKIGTPVADDAHLSVDPDDYPLF